MYLNISLKILLSREKSYKSFFTKKTHPSWTERDETWPKWKLDICWTYLGI